MCRLLTGVLLFAAAGFGQRVIEPSRIPPELRDFTPLDGEKALSCSVRPILPNLNFSFRFQAGYVAELPMQQFIGTGHQWVVFARITPEQGQPVFLLSGVRLPEIPATKVRGSFGGGFLLGEGRYRVDWMLIDDRNRVCRKSWKVRARLRGSERKVTPGLPANTIRGMAGRSRPAPGSAVRNDDVRPLRLTVLMHAAAMNPRSPRIRAGERVMLLGLLASLIEQLPARSVRLVVFNLDQQKELLRSDSFSPETLDQAAQAINSLALGSVDYKVLQNRHGHLNLLADLVNQELRRPERSDAVIFIGPPARQMDKIQESALETRAGPAPNFYYFQYTRFFGGYQFGDSIESATKEMKGKTFKIHTPGEFAKAIEQLGTQLAGDR